MNFIKNTLILMLGGLGICNNAASLNGIWISKEDKDYIISINNETFSEIYNAKTTTYSYTRGASCDSSYMKDKTSTLKLSLDDGRCFEITGLTKTTLAYRYTASGKLQTFYRK